jgi:hypothetical protein
MRRLGIKPIPLTEKDALVLRAGSFAFFQSNQTIDPILPTSYRSLAKGKRQKIKYRKNMRLAKPRNW